MQQPQMTRRSALKRLGKGTVTLLTISAAARALGLPTRAQASQKIFIGSQPINPLLASYIGAVNPFAGDGRDTEITRFRAGPAMIQAMAAGDIVFADTGIVPAMIAAARGLPVMLPYLSSFGAPGHPI